MKMAYNKDIIQTIKKGKKRFFSLMLITILGVTMFNGIRAACVDLRYSADEFFDAHNLYDISIVSTLGLTDDDIIALEMLEGVADVEGGYSENVHVVTGELTQTAEVKVLTQEGINVPYIIVGTLPETDKQIAVTDKYVQENGKQIGDTVTITELLEEDEDASFTGEEYVISGVVIDPTDINSPSGAISFRATNTTDYTFFVTAEAVSSEVYTIAYITLDNAKEIMCYDDKYEKLISDMMAVIDGEIKEVREQARYDEIIEEANSEIASAEAEMNEEFSEAESEIESAKAEITEGWEEIESAQTEIEEGWEEIESARTEIEEGWIEIESAGTDIVEGWLEVESAQAEIEEGWIEIESAQAEIDNGRIEIESAQLEINEGWLEIESAQAERNDGWLKLEAAQSELNSNREQLEAAKAQLDEQGKYITEQMPEAWAQYQASLAEVEAGFAALDTAQQELDNNKEILAAANTPIHDNIKLLESAQTELNAHIEELNEGQAELDANKTELEEAQVELENAINDLNEGQTKLDESVIDLNEAQTELEEAIADLLEGEAELEESITDIEEGEAELLENIATFEKEKADAIAELDEAKAEVADIEKGEWYIQNRESLSGYANVKSDADCIESIGTAFPIIFLVVAILISLTTITRMVEEDRGLIGTYKALGFSDGEIRRKYVIYAFSACLAGGILGDICGFVVLPKIIFIIFGVMYQLPEYFIKFDIIYGVAGMLLFVVGVVGATLISCTSELKASPATLMRPKAPRSGSRVFLERIKPVWGHMSFLNKVTARNLFRYKKRLFMTLFGIAGCTGLLVCGFGIKDTVQALMPLQYDNIYKYDIMTIAEDNDKLIDYVENNSNIAEYTSVYVESIKVINSEGKEDKAQLIVMENVAEYAKYIHLEAVDGTMPVPEDGKIYLTKNLSDVLGFEANENVTLQDMTFARATVSADYIVKNYLGNNVYMTKNTYEMLFGRYEANGILAVLSDSCTDEVAFSDTLGRQDGILSSISVESMKNDFAPAFTLLNMVVYVVIVLAAGLAFTVLFTLATTNISERERELATIKVLGFFDREVHAYVNKETMILTGFGVLIGLPVGYILTDWLMGVLKLSSINFVTTVSMDSYFISAGLSVVFAIVVNFITDRSLDVINPVEALKSIE